MSKFPGVDRGTDETPHAPPGAVCKPHPRLLVIGGGNMGSAIVLGALAAGSLTAKRLLMVEPDAVKRKALEEHHVRTVATASDGMNWANGEDNCQVLLAVKPQMLEALAEEFRPHWQTPRIIISILAGTPGRKIIALLGPGHHIVRAMPSLPASIGMSTTAMCLSDGAVAGDDAFARRLFSAIGPSVLTIREEQMDAFTAVAGSGPAYLFYLAESMQRAAVAQGFEETLAAEMCRSTLLGAATMLAGLKIDAATLRAQVTSKGGTTEAAIRSFDSHGVSQSIEAGIAAGTARAKELGR